MKKLHLPALLLSLIAGVCFVFSFITPFICSNFRVDHAIVHSSSEVVQDPCEVVFESFLPAITKNLPSIPGINIFKSIAKSACNSDIAPKIRDYSYMQLDNNLGPITMPKTGTSLSWRECSEQEDVVQNLNSSCCDPEDEKLTPLKACSKLWIAERAAIPLGDQRILPVISHLYTMGEVPIAVLLLIFSVLFPLTKALSAILCSIGFRPRWLMTFLIKTSKWSMVDVFVVGLLIAFFKADLFAFAFSPEVGVYLFATAAILSSIAVMVIESAMKKSITQNG